MSREIKFRAWDELEKRMWTLDDAGEDSGDGSIQYFSENGSLEFGRLEYYGTGLGVNSHFEKFPLMQYTGLKDKNGKEIFEGDIVKTHDQNNVIEYEHGSFLVKGLHADEYERTYSVLYHYLVDATIPDMPHSRFDGVTTDLEIIGNIYENPELLEATT